MSLGRAFTALKSLGATLEEKPSKVERIIAEEPLLGMKPVQAEAQYAPFWEMLATDPKTWDLDAQYRALRKGQPVSTAPLVCIVVPKYREMHEVVERGQVSRNDVRKDLHEHGIGSFTGSIVGDSLVCRMRQRACHNFLVSPATHLLFWDADIECLTPDCVRHMLASGHDIVAGACPFKDLSGRTVHNLFPEQNVRDLTTDEYACLEVQDAGSGFMLISRRTLYAMQQAYPGTRHRCMSLGPERGAPLWALFDTGVIDDVYQSEDYMFCHLWQQLGGSVHVYVPGRFRHWGSHGFEGSIEKQYGLTLHTDESRGTK